MRWLLLKDLQILRRSPLLVSLLVIYPIAIALMIGFAISSPPAKPKVAIDNEIPASKAVIHIGGTTLNANTYQQQLLTRVDPIFVKSRDAAIRKVRSGEALAGIVIPKDLPGQLEDGGRPTVEIFLNVKDPLVKQYVDSQLRGELTKANQAIINRVARVALNFLDDILQGGRFDGFGIHVTLLGLQSTQRVLEAVASSLPPGSTARAGLAPAINFAKTASTLLAFRSQAVSLLASPVQFKRIELAGRTTPPDRYAATIAMIVSLMFVTLLLAAGLLALEREEHAFGRLVRGLVSRTTLLAEKISISALCAAAVTLLMTLGIAAFVSPSWGRLPLWVISLLLGGFAFAALGVAIGALTREVRAASLLSFLLSLPIAFLALIPKNAVSETLYDVLSIVSGIFPFKPALLAMDNAFNGTGSIGLPLLHLVVLTIAFGALARVALRRFG